MVDNFDTNAASGGVTFASDDVSGVHYPILKLALGALDAVTLLSGNSGTKDAGTIRVVLATDQPALTNKLLVTPDLPSGASTAAKQPALGTAGSASSDVITVQGIASMTPLLVDASGAAVPITDNSGSLTVDYATTGSGNATGALRVELANNGTGILATLGTITNVVHIDDNSGTLSIDDGAGNISIDDGGNSITVDYATTGSGNATGALRVELANNGTGLLSTVSTVTTLTTLTGGGVAHDGADSGNPVKVGAKALASPAGATMVADADRTNLVSDLDGALLVRTGTALGDVLNNGSQSVTDTTSTAVTNLGATASSKNCITDIVVWNSSATDTFVKLQDGSGGTTFWIAPAPQTGGSVQHFDPPLRQTTANTALYFAANASASTIYVAIKGYKSKV